MSKILIVDDSQVDRSLISGLLCSRADYQIETAEDGRQAMARIARMPVDLVLTDLMMPNMDGLQLVRALRASHPEVPVILLTAYGNEALAVEALEAGAASYVPKAQQAARLSDTVARVLEHATADREGDRLAQCVLEHEMRLSLDNDLTLIRPLLGQVHRMMASVGFADRCERIRAGEALEEALLNAMYHGNLEISERELTELRMDDHGRLETFVEDRRREPQYRDRRVLVVIQISPSKARFVVRDEGRGYTVPREADVTKRAFEHGDHRGLTLIRSLMDEVRFNGVGNELSMSKEATPMAGAL